MPDTTLNALAVTAAIVGLGHTLTGPDHFLPFIAMSRAGRWSLGKTLIITTACGIAHVLSSVAIGLAGLALGAAVARLVGIEEVRGSIAGWLLFGFGLAYMVWGLRRAVRPRALVDEAPQGAARMTPWILFLIFVFGPCEPLIPLLMYPAASVSPSGTVLVTCVFGAATLGTMLSLVALGYLGLARFADDAFHRYSHAACGAAITLCGAAVCLGL